MKGTNFITVVSEDGTKEQVKVVKCFRAAFVDNRQVSILYGENDTYYIYVHNVGETTRAKQMSMTLTPESFKALFFMMQFFSLADKWDVQAEINNVANKGLIDYEYIGVEDPF